jgi:hypothetical protein
MFGRVCKKPRSNWVNQLVFRQVCVLKIKLQVLNVSGTVGYRSVIQHYRHEQVRSKIEVAGNYRATDCVMLA